jgi:hypothetical protein
MTVHGALESVGATARRCRRTVSALRVTKLPHRYVFAIACVLGLWACGGARIDMEEGEFPAPLVEPIPLRVGLYLDPALVAYKHVEKIDQQGTWEVDVGSIQPRLFRTVTHAMFTDVAELTAPPPAPNVDVVLAPAIEAFQMTIPAQTRSNFYEVWIKYRMALFQPDGTVIAQWPLTAYGKSNREDFGIFQKKDDLAVREATVNALRDAGAFLSLRFKRVPEVKAWLESRHSENGVPAEEPKTVAAPAGEKTS